MDEPFQLLQAVAGEELARLMEELPAELLKKMESVAFVLEPYPGEDSTESGIGSDYLGLFSGPSVGSHDAAAVPRVTLWLQNIWQYARQDREEFRRQVRITLLHEIGHYLDLDEDDLRDRGLE